LSSGYLPCVFLKSESNLASALAASSGLVLRLRKCVQAANAVFPLWVRRRERTDLSLLPMYNTTLPLALPISYTPVSVVERASIISFLNSIQVAFIGTVHPPVMIDATHRLAYPLAQRLEGIANGTRIRNGDSKSGL
jgi:hypothetical protein